MTKDTYETVSGVLLQIVRPMDGHPGFSKEEVATALREIDELWNVQNEEGKTL